MSGNKASDWKVVCEADDDVIERDLLAWSGLSDQWLDCGIDGNFISNIAEECDSIEILTEQWDADFPGRSGVRYIISTNSPDKLKKELRYRLDEFIREHRQDPGKN